MPWNLRKEEECTYQGKKIKGRLHTDKGNKIAKRPMKTLYPNHTRHIINITEKKSKNHLFYGKIISLILFPQKKMELF